LLLDGEFDERGWGGKPGGWSEVRVGITDTELVA
jgi:hypothetical protein